MENTIPENPILRSSGVLHAESEQPTNASTLFDPLNFELAFASFQLLDLAPAIKTPLNCLTNKDLQVIDELFDPTIHEQ
jgi:hypothetical protein